MKKLLAFFLSLLATLAPVFLVSPVYADKPLDNFQGRPPLHVHGKPNVTTPTGLSPQTIKSAYGLPSTGGTGTIAIVDAYDYPTALNDFNVFSSQYGLPTCNSTACFEKHPMANKLRTNSGWALEAALDTQWAHAIAPNAKILLVEAKSASGTDLLNAVNYAKTQPGVVAVSMSWGGAEFSGESAYDGNFLQSGVTFFASSGDSGTGVQWPAVSVNVAGVGGTTLNFVNGLFSSETAWGGSGGGLSAYELEPSYQSAYGVPNANGFRAVPDVAFDADPNSGVSVYDSTPYQGTSGWFQVGGTSVGSPVWAGIRAQGGTATNSNFYPDATKNYTSFFRDITSGSNGTCALYCAATTGYDYITGLGSPLTVTY